jgi:hypothetical protein
MLKADGFDKAVIGLTRREEDSPVVLLYSTEKCIDILMDQGMDWEEAQEYFDFNVACAWMGPETPVFEDAD